MKKLKLLISNDDGIQAEGIARLARAIGGTPADCVQTAIRVLLDGYISIGTVKSPLFA